MRYKRTESAARADKQARWALIEAIAADAADAGYPITGIESCMATRAALEKAHAAASEGQVRKLVTVAKFDWESDAQSRKVWRRYGWSVIGRVAQAGWSQEQAYDFLAYDRRTVADVDEELHKRNTNVGIPTSLDEEWFRWISAINALMVKGAKLAEQSDRRRLTSLSRLAYATYQSFVDRKIDAEVRDLFEREGLTS